MKPAHRRGTYSARASQVTQAAYNDPETRCGMCGQTLADHPPTKTGKPQTWDADHLRPGDPLSPLRPVAASCNRAAGGAIGAERQRLGIMRPTNPW